MLRKSFLILIIMAFFMGPGSVIYAQIVVENESAKWEVALVSTESPDIAPRVVTEYATSITHIGLIQPPDFARPPRIIVEYATGITAFGLAKFPFCECDLNQDHSCNGLDWLQFYPDWGRTDCNEPGAEVCECDLNADGSCNGLDWLVFYPDWGRDDCPIFP